MIYVIYGHSGSGKTTLASNLEKAGLKWIPTYTTRPKRNKSEKGYNFISHLEFTKMDLDYPFIGKREFTTVYGGEEVVYRYGVDVRQLADALIHDEDAVIITDAIGVDEMFEIFGYGNVCAVYMYGDKKDLKNRAALRKDFDEREWERRYRADSPTLSVEEFASNAAGDKLVSGRRYYAVDIRLSEQAQVDYFKEVILG